MWRIKVLTAQIQRGLRLYADFVVALLIVITVDTYLSFDQQYTGFFVALASALASFLYLAGTAGAAFVWLVRGRPRRVAASASKCLAFFLLWRPLFWAGDYVHLALDYPIYRQQIEAQPSGSPAQVRFFWGDKALWVTQGYLGETLIYDPSDTLATTIDEVQPGHDQGFNLITRHLIGHFYIEYEFSS